MPVLAMAIPRVTYMKDFRSAINSITEHIVKALVVCDSNNQKKWLKDAENSFRNPANRPTKIPLKITDIMEIRDYLQLETHNVTLVMNVIMRAYNYRLTLRHIDIESLVFDFNEIMDELAKVMIDYRLKNDECPVGCIKDSAVVAQKLKEYELLDTFFVNGKKQADKVIECINNDNEIIF